MNDLAQSFETLLGRQPTDAEVQQLYRVRDALGIAHNDALWVVLMALQYYQDLYDKVPGRIAQASNEAVAAFTEIAKVNAAAALMSAHAELSKSVAASAQQVARDTAIKQKWQWIAGAVAVVALCAGGLAWGMHQVGYEAGWRAGQAAGYSEARDEKAAAAWANTPEGQLAYRFAQFGELQRLAKCQGKGWVEVKGNCYAQAAVDGKNYGWRVR